MIRGFLLSISTFSGFKDALSGDTIWELVKPGTKKWETGNEETEIGNGLETKPKTLKTFA